MTLEETLKYLPGLIYNFLLEITGAIVNTEN